MKRSNRSGSMALPPLMPVGALAIADENAGNTVAALGGLSRALADVVAAASTAHAERALAARAAVAAGLMPATADAGALFRAAAAAALRAAAARVDAPAVLARVAGYVEGAAARGGDAHIAAALTSALLSACSALSAEAQEPSALAALRVVVGATASVAGNIIAAGAGSVKTNDQAAGLQLAVWNVLYNGGDKLDLSHGAFRATASASALGYAEQFFALRNKAGHSVYSAAF